MDTKSHIKELMEKRNWTLYELSKRSGVSQTTLANMWKRNTEPSIPTLNDLCAAFGITLSQFFAEGQLVELTAQQHDLLSHWDCLSDQQKNALIELIKTINR